MTSWSTRPLRALGRWYGGGTPSKAEATYWDGGTIPWLSPKDMGPERLRSTRDKITLLAAKESAAKVVPAQSVAVVTRSGVLERRIPVALVPFETALNQDMKAVVAVEDVLPQWIAWGLRAYESELLSSARKAGTTVASLNFAALLDFKLPVPAIEEQRRIIEILEEHLSSLDTGNANLDVAEKRLDGMIAAELSVVTSGSTLVAMKDLTREATYGTSTKCVVGGSGPKVIRIPNIVRGRVDLADEKRAVDSEVDLRSLMVSEGDLLIIRTNGSRNLIGRSGVVDGPLDASFASYLIRYRLDRDCVRPAWVQRALGLPRVRQEIERLAASSAGQYNLSLGKLAGLELPVPNLAKQDAWLEASARLEDAVSSQRRMLGTQRRRSAALRRALLEAAFSGRLTGRASDLDRAEEAIAS